MGKVVFIAGGGTGGHIYPGIAIADQLKQKGFEPHFIGTQNGLEKELVPRSHYPLHFIKIGKLNSTSLIEKLKTLFFLPYSFLQSFFLINKFKPQFVLGVGGYASGPMVLVATLLSIPTAIWEPNAYPGLANRWLSKYVQTAFVLFEKTLQYLSVKNYEVLGMPVREEFEKNNVLPLKNPSEFHLLVFGGSQGAQRINELVSMIAPDLAKAEIYVIHQTGPRSFEQIKKQYESISKKLVAKAYLHKIIEDYQQADLVICRSGASTLAELAALGKAAILIPLPTSADDHQRKNAEALAQAKASELQIQIQLTPQKLLERILYYKSHPGSLKTLSENIRAFHRPQAATKIADRIEKLIHGE